MFLLPFPTTFHFLSYPGDSQGFWKMAATDSAKWRKSSTQKWTPYPGNCRVQHKDLRQMSKYQHHAKEKKKEKPHLG